MESILAIIDSYRYMNTGNSRAIYDGLQLKWLTPSTVTYVVPWEELFKKYTF